MAIEFITSRWLSRVRLWREGKKEAAMEEKLGKGIEQKGGRRLREGEKGFPRHPSCDNEDQQQVVVPSHGNYARWLLTVQCNYCAQ